MNRYRWSFRGVGGTGGGRGSLAADSKPRETWVVMTAVALVSVLVGCAGGVREELPVPVELILSVSEKANPTESGRPSPVHLRVFELSNVTAFETADFFELQAGDGAKAETVESNEYVLLPGEVRVVRKRAATDARFIGVVAAYRDLEGSVWRASVPLPAPHFAGRVWGGALSPGRRYYIVAGEREVVIREGRP